MSLLTELFGPEVVNESLDDIKKRINALPPTQMERRSYLLHDYAAIRGIKLTRDDFADVRVYYDI